MKVIIAGSRTITDYDVVLDAMEGIHWGTSGIVSGGALGVDKLGEQYAVDANLDLKVFPADWDKYGRAAGFIRNAAMADYADGLVAIWDGKSKGTENMIRCMVERKKQIYIYFV